ncbi:MAG: hypothetical protein ACKVWR_04775 [Acidimicrobiales bacterium]
MAKQFGEDFISNLKAHDDIRIDIDTDEVLAADRGVAAGEDIEDSAVNSGNFAGIQNGSGHVHAQDAIIGDDNVRLDANGSGAVALGGNATNVNAYNANLGSGDLTNVESYGGGQTVVGDGNETTGDVDVRAHDVSGNFNLAIGDKNLQSADQHNTDIFDASVEDNSVVKTDLDFSDRSVTTLAQDNSQTFDIDTRIDESDNSIFSVEDNSREIDNSVFQDNDELDLRAEFTRLDSNVDLDDSDDNNLDVLQG